MNPRLTIASIHALCQLSKESDFPYKIIDNGTSMVEYCKGAEPEDGTTQVYGISRKNGELVSVMTASFMKVFPDANSPHGKIVHISGEYTKKEYRHGRYAALLLEAIEEDARKYGADYLYCDNPSDEYKESGFKYLTEIRMWKVLKSEDL